MSTQPETDKLVRVFIKMRAARSAIKDVYELQDNKLKEDMKQIEIELLRRAIDQGVEGFTTAAGTTYIAEEVHASIGDPDAFTAFLDETEDPYLFYEQRPSLKRIKEWQDLHKSINPETEKVEMGPPPPGIRLFRENRMRVRAKSNSKTKKGEANES
jgi:hypothetical protein